MNAVLSALAISLLLIAGCDATDPNTAPSTEVDPNPPYDSDITPPSGTGGETQSVSPDGTTSTEQKAVPEQPTPTD